MARTNVNEFYFNIRLQFLSANERGEVIYIGRDKSYAKIGLQMVWLLIFFFHSN